MDFDKLKKKYSRIVEQGDWWDYEYGDGTWVLLEDLPVGQPVWLDEDVFTVVEMQLDYDHDLYTSQVHIVINTQGEYFKLVGRKNSYGESSWNDSWSRVKPRERTVVTYE